MEADVTLQINDKIKVLLRNTAKCCASAIYLGKRQFSEFMNTRWPNVNYTSEGQQVKFRGIRVYLVDEVDHLEVY